MHVERWQPCGGVEGGGESSNRRRSLMERRGCPRRGGANVNTDKDRRLLGSPCICREPSPALWAAMDESSVYQHALPPPSLLCTHRPITTCCAGSLFSVSPPCVSRCARAHTHSTVSTMPPSRGLAIFCPPFSSGLFFCVCVCAFLGRRKRRRGGRATRVRV